MSECACDTCGRLSIRKRIHVAPPMTSEEFYGACSLQGSEDCLGVALDNTRAQLATALRERDEAREGLITCAAALDSYARMDPIMGSDLGVVARRSLAAIRGTEGK